MSLRAVVRILGFLLLVTAAMLLLPALVALIYREGDGLAFLGSAAIGALAGAAAMYGGRGAPEPRAREGFAIVTFGWICVGLLGALPFTLGGQIPSFTDAVFESISGFTTTGASILTDIEGRSHAVLFWRALTHWLGGMGIVVLALAVLPLLGVGGMQLFRAEVPGPTPDRLTPRIRQTAKLLWGVYVLLTVVETLALTIAGMSLFDAVCHAFATMATGGFSTRDASVGAYASPAIEWIIIVFMLLAGINFNLHYLALTGRLRAYWQDEECRTYVGILGLAFVLIVTVLLRGDFFPTAAETVRTAIFQVISICTTTGFGTSDYLLWPPLTHAVLLILMAVGGSAGSTGGGVKVMRVLVLFKHARVEMQKLLHPRGVFTSWFNGRPLRPTTATNVLGFFLLFALVYIAGILILTAGGRDIVTAIGATAATLGNIGPGLGDVGPTCNFAFLAGWEKWFLTLLMIIGRLEIYTVLILVLPGTWRKS